MNKDFCFSMENPTSNEFFLQLKSPYGVLLKAKNPPNYPESLIKNKSLVLFFGNKNFLNLDNIQSSRPHWIEQTHSDISVPAEETNLPSPPKADAHYTNRTDVLLPIKTADCLPILLFSIETPLIIAIHAGWRGTCSLITHKTLQEVIHTFKINPQKLVAFIGPHIQKNSFNIGEDVKSELDLCREKMLKLAPPHIQLQLTDLKVSELSGENKQAKGDLLNLNKMALNTLGIENIFPSKDDTFTLSYYHSFRRDKTKGRNLSFIGWLNQDEIKQLTGNGAKD